MMQLKTLRPKPLGTRFALAEKTRSFPVDNSMPQSRVTQGLTLLLAMLVLTCLNKFILGTGQNFSTGQIMIQSSAEISYARLSSFAILCLSVLLTAFTGISKKAVKNTALFWLPLLAYMWLRIPILEGNAAILFRTLNFFAVIISMSLLTCNRKTATLFLDNIYYLMAISNFIGLAFYLFKIPFSYFTDGYGIMFTGIFPQKDLLSTTAALGALIAVQRSIVKINYSDGVIFILQILTLFLASTLSSLGAFFFGFFGLFAPRFAIAVTGFLAVLLPILYPIVAPITALIGKDPTLTGRTRLWDFALKDASETPLFGHGFRHISATRDWMQMLQSEFRSDSFFIPHAHNVWIEILDKFGIFGILILISTLILFPILCNQLKRPSALDRLCFALLSFWLFKSALTVPFLNSDTTAYLWTFCLSFSVAWWKSTPSKSIV
jgi:O-antigen ligase